MTITRTEFRVRRRTFLLRAAVFLLPSAVVLVMLLSAEPGTFLDPDDWSLLGAGGWKILGIIGMVGCTSIGVVFIYRFVRPGPDIVLDERGLATLGMLRWIRADWGRVRSFSPRVVGESVLPTEVIDVQVDGMPDPFRLLIPEGWASDEFVSRLSAAKDAATNG